MGQYAAHQPVKRTVVRRGVAVEILMVPLCTEISRHWGTCWGLNDEGCRMFGAHVGEATFLQIHTSSLTGHRLLVVLLVLVLAPPLLY